MGRAGNRRREYLKHLSRQDPCCHLSNALEGQISNCMTLPFSLSRSDCPRTDYTLLPACLLTGDSYHSLKGKFLCSAVSNPQNCSKRFTLYFPGRPIQSDTISTSLESIHPYAAINARIKAARTLIMNSSELEQCTVKNLAQGFNIATQDSNPGSLALLAKHTILIERLITVQKSPTTVGLTSS